MADYKAIINKMTVGELCRLFKLLDGDYKLETFVYDGVLELYFGICDTLESMIRTGTDETAVRDVCVDKGKLVMEAHFVESCVDANIIQRDVDDFVTEDVAYNVDVVVDFDTYWNDVTLAEAIALFNNEVEETASEEYDNACAEAAEEYRERHSYLY